MSSKTNYAPIHIERNSLGEFTFYEDYVVAEWRNPEIDNFALMRMEKVAKEVYGPKSWGYVSNRTHATVSNPSAVYQMLQRDCVPVAIAIVAYSMRSHIVAKIEKDYCKGVSLEIFNQLESATDWIQGQVENTKLESGRTQDLLA